ncbi:hypothetical protein LSH36_268g02029 [Paralvinella palmiformis]|uniref:Uncharacterized protein n=1 Tax=Paralvinella palmiformis TaxID=53620 RepID=A0AAD9JL65_9ANNE|nr:hypothetical protein LSH36_268g02029 [Paralvinella palmiformis]
MKFSVVCIWLDEVYVNQTLSSMSAGEKEKMLLHNKEVERFDIHAQDTTVCLCCSGDAGMTETTKKKCVILYRMCYFTKHSAVLAKLIMQELKVSHIFRQNFVRYAFSHWERMKCQYIEWKTDCTVPSVLIIGLEWPNQNILDYKWNYRLCKLTIRALQLADGMNWLNTLGGGYSALGDYSRQHAKHAGQISCRQLCCAVEMGDPSTVIRCHLYYALSLMQTGRLRGSKYTIRRCYKKAQSLIVPDLQLLAMCKGMWSRLQYKYMQKKNRNIL